MSDDSFLNLIDDSLSDFFKDHGFKLEKCSTVDHGNKATVIFRSPKCKLMFYKSVREGEVNCLIGNSFADNDDLHDGNWQYLNSFLSSQSDQTIKQLLANVPDVPKSSQEQVSEIEERLKTNFESILAGGLGE